MGGHEGDTDESLFAERSDGRESLSPTATLAAEMDWQNTGIPRIYVCQVAELTHRLAHLAEYKGHLRGIPQINLIKNCVYYSVLKQRTKKDRRRRKPGVKYQN